MPSLLVFQAQIPAELQGRAYAARILITRSLLPVAFLGTGLVVDEFLEQRLTPGGPWAADWVRTLLGADGPPHSPESGEARDD